MPKKFTGENSKSAAARNRKATAKEVDSAKKQKAVEDAQWEDDDKAAKKRHQKKEEEQRKKQIALEKKAEAKAQLEKEMESIIKPTKHIQPKLTRAQIEASAEQQNQLAKSETDKTHIEKPLEENLNRIQTEESAHNIDEALAVLSITETGNDKHPEKRMKAAYAAFEERTFPRLKEENPTMRLSQLKQLLHKEWQKSPENPLYKPA